MSFKVKNDFNSGCNRLENFVTTGTFCKKEGGNWYVNVGLKSQVRIQKWYLNLFSIVPEIGRKILVYVSRYSNRDSKTVINESYMVYIKQIQFLNYFFKNNRTIKGTINRVRFGGLTVKVCEIDVNGEKRYIEGFLPNSFINHMDGKMLLPGKSLSLNIKDFNMDKKTLLLIPANRNQDLRYSFNDLSVGSEVSGYPIRILTYGIIFKINSGLTAFLSYKDMNFREEYDQELLDNLTMDKKKIEGLVIYKIDQENMKVYLTAKHVFDSLGNYFKVNDVVKGTIISVKNFGYIVNLHLINNDESINIKAILEFKLSGWKHSYFERPLKVGFKSNFIVNRITTKKVFLSLRFEENNFWNDIEKQFPLFSDHRLNIVKDFGGSDSVYLHADRKNCMVVLRNRSLLEKFLLKNSLEAHGNLRVKILKYNYARGLIVAGLSRYYSLLEFRKIRNTSFISRVHSIENDIVQVFVGRDLTFSLYPDIIRNVNLEVGKLVRCDVTRWSFKTGLLHASFSEANLA